MSRIWKTSAQLALLGTALVCAVLACFTNVRAQNTKQPQATVVPLRPLAALSMVPVPDVPGISNYVRSNAWAITLGKALFWDMQVGSDGVQACASCHFNAGADSRAINQASPGLKAGDITFQLGNPRPDGSLGPNYLLHAGTPDAGFGGYHNGDFPLHKQGNVDDRNSPLSDVNDVISSQGVFSTHFDQIVVGGGVDKTTVSSDVAFSYPDPANPGQTINTRRVEPRNTPSVVNAVFNYRNFWDGRAQNICNGVNPFGDRDISSHLFMKKSTSAALVPALVRLKNSALCSQALGPALSPFEMSADGRSFKHLGKKLLSLNPLQNFAPTTPLGMQLVDPYDSYLGALSKNPAKGLKTTYVAMVQNAFDPRWWASSWHVCIAPDNTETLIDPTAGGVCPAGAEEFTQMEYNFSLFWGIAIQMYESVLRADNTPLDQYLQQQKSYLLKGDDKTNFFSFSLKTAVVPYTLSLFAVNSTLDASDQDVFAFDDGHGNITGIGVTSGTINYSTGLVTVFFDLPPKSAYPIQFGYSTGPTPLTAAQLHGLQLFQTKGRCIACHGGPELTNASAANVSANPMERMLMGDLKTIRVYDNGFYNIGVRLTNEDIALGDVDGVAGLPLSQSEIARRQVCNDPSLTIMIPGRPGEGISAAPLACWDEVGRYGNMKTPGLRNVALTAPYFHNGGQLTLEQVVEFYNRGGDFPDGTEQLKMDGDLTPETVEQIQFIDPNITPLFLTIQEKTDLVDFLRNALTDARTVNQQAPFDHPQIFLPNGHPQDPNGYWVVNDPNHPGQATDQPYPMLMLPAVGKAGGTPPKTFLQNLAVP